MTHWVDLAENLNTNKLTQSRGKFLHPDLPLLDLHAWELSSYQLEIKSFGKMLQTLSQNQDEHLLRKSMIQNESYTPVGVIERRLIWSWPLLQSWPISLFTSFLRKSVK